MSAVVAEATTFLFVPGNRSDRFDKAAATGADVVILDLEDAVASSAEKAQAREAVAAWLSDGGQAVVRVNPLSSGELQADLAALDSAPGLVAIMVAKADQRSVQYVAEANPAPIVALIETAAGIDAARAVASQQRVVRLAFGHLDFAQDIGARPSHAAMQHARSALVLASRLGGLAGPVDGVTPSLDDDDALLQDIRHAHELGMTAKLLIHPRQVVPAKAAFRPGEREISWALRILESAGSGDAVRVDGEMVDAPVIARALSITRAAGVTGPS